MRKKKKLNIRIAKENILILRKILNKTQIRWSLIFGTLLGAVRENNFIEHDTDIDILVYHEDSEKLFKILHLLENKGFRIVRFYKSRILSVERKNELIDFFFFKKTFFGRNCGVYYIPKKFFKTFNKIKFLSKDFTVINDVKKYLEYQYGSTWKISIKNDFAKGNYFGFVSLGEFGRTKLPFLYYKIYLKLRRFFFKT